MKSLCIDARMAFSSGIGTYLREIVPFFHNSSFRITLLVDQLGSDWCKDFEQIVFDAPIYSLKEQALYPLKIPPSDLFWSPHYNVPLLPIRAKKRIATMHDICHLALGSFLEKTYAKFVMGRAVHVSNQVITVSQFSKQEIEKYFKKGTVEAITIGVNRSRFIRTAPCSKVREKYQLEDRFILFVGNHKPHKNIEGLRRAFKRANIPNLQLVLVGKGTPIGRVADEDLPALYSMAEAFIFPSFYEGFGLPPLEAMCCGCPTVVSRAASIPEVCGDASLYFDPADDLGMAAAICKISKDSEVKKDLIRKGFERVQLFDWKKSAEKHIEIFERVAFA